MSGVVYNGVIFGQLILLFQKLNRAETDFAEESERLVAEMVDSELPEDLTLKVKNYSEYLFRKFKRTRPESSLTDGSSTLSVSLKQEIADVLHARFVSRVPLFVDLEHGVITGLCMAMSLQIYLPMSHVLRAGERNQELFFVVKGELLKKKKKR